MDLHEMQPVEMSVGLDSPTIKIYGLRGKKKPHNPSEHHYLYIIEDKEVLS